MRGPRTASVLLLLASLPSLCAAATSALEDQQGRDAPLLAVADLHGDLNQTLAALHLAGAIDGNGRWDAGGATLVQTGDVLDRGPDSIAIVQLLERLRGEALAAGGHLITLLGNHELMNIGGDFRYMLPAELAWLARNATDPATAGSSWDRHKPEDAEAGRALWAAALAVGAPIGDALRRRRIVALAGHGPCRTLFVHAGLTPHVMRTAATLARQDLAGLSPVQRVEVVDQLFTAALQQCFPRDGSGCQDGDGGSSSDSGSTAQAALTLLKAVDGPVWLRSYVRKREAKVCAEVAEVLQLVGAAQMVVGHNVQSSGRARQLCNGTLHLIDTGVSRAYGGAAAAWRCVDGTASAVHAVDSNK